MAAGNTMVHAPSRCQASAYAVTCAYASLLGAAAAAASPAAGATSTRTAARVRNIVHMVFDDFRPDLPMCLALGCTLQGLRLVFDWSLDFEVAAQRVWGNARTRSVKKYSSVPYHYIMESGPNQSSAQRRTIDLYNI